MSINAQNDAPQNTDAAPGTGPDTGPDTGPGSTDSAAAAARLLALTARDTDQWRAEAREEAAGIVAAAREEAATIVRAAREEAEQMTNDARVEAYREREKATKLKEASTAHREQLRSHLTEMLERVEAIPEG